MLYPQPLIAMAIALSLSAPAVGQDPSAASAPSPPLRPPLVCPTDLDQLTPLLLRDLPAYVNRVAQRSLGRYGRDDRPGVLILASPPDYGALSLGPGPYMPTQSEDEPEQVFFTTLERHYVPDGAGVLLQAYHWAFLTHSSGQWRLALLFSSTDEYPAGQPPSPPDDASQGAIAQAIRLWLRDCAAGAVGGSG